MARPYEDRTFEPEYPLRIEEDWSYEIHDARGRTVASCQYGAHARLLVDAANAENTRKLKEAARALEA